MLEISVPASLSNLGPGFDTLGMALTHRNTFRIRGDLSPGHFEANGVRMTGSDHLVCATAIAAGEAFGRPLAHGLAVSQEECVPRARGLGSSATARVAGFMAWSHFSGVRPPTDDIIGFLTEAEGHPDNVVPAWVGGFTVAVVGRTGVFHRRYEPPAQLRVALAIPDLEVPTADARAALPAMLPHADAVYSSTRLAVLVAGLVTHDAEAIRVGVDDRLHHPYRAGMIGPVDEVIAAARDRGADAGFISGSGSTIAALVLDPNVDIESVAQGMAGVFVRHGVGCQAVATRADRQGALGA